VDYSEKIIQSFSEETRELLSTLDFNLVKLEQDPKDQDIINEIFRISHSIKSSAALMGLALLSDTAHKIEDLFILVRSGKVVIDSGLISFLLKSSDLLSYILERSVKGESAEDDRISDYRIRLSGILSIYNGIGSEHPPETVLYKEKEPLRFNETDNEIIRIEQSRGNTVYHVSISLYPEVGLKYARCFLILNSIKDDCRIIKTHPDIEQDQNNDPAFQEFEAVLSTTLKEKELQSRIEDSEIQEISITPVQLENAKGQETSSERAIKLETGIKISVEEVDRIVTLLSDLVLTRNELNALKLTVKEKMSDSIAYDRLNESLFKLEDVTNHLQSEFMRVRMVPIEMLFKPFFKYVRETASSLNKDVELQTFGQETLIDRTLMDRLIHPLTHLIRNSLSHGIEFRTERIEKNKLEKARLILNAYQMGHNIIIEVEDDGRGLDAEKIKSRALDRGLLTLNKDLTDSELLNLICTPGFSTSTAVSDLSGRGVGMDVVRSTMEKLQGVLEMSTKKDEGTKFRLIIPMSLSVMKTLLVKAGDDTIAIPINFISETLLLKRNELTEDIDSLIHKNYPVTILSKMWTGKQDKPLPEFLKVLKTSYQGKEMGLAVDEILTEQDLIIKDVDEAFKQNPCISAGSILGDGRIVFILNILNLIKEHT